MQVLICYGVQNTKGVAFSKELNDAYVHDTYYKVIGELDLTATTEATVRTLRRRIPIKREYFSVSPRLEKKVAHSFRSVLRSLDAPARIAR